MSPMLKNKLLFIFIVSFILNIVWENFHSIFYDNYMGGKITEFILFRAALADAIIIIIITLPFLLFLSFKKRSWAIIFIGFVVSIGIEYYVLTTGMWEYNILMPIIPFLSIGLTPTIQLGLLGYISFQVQKYF